MAQSGFTLDDLIRMGPDEVTRRKKLAEAMLAQGQDFSPIASPLQGFARLAQALTGAIGEWRANKAETEGRASANKAFASLFSGGGNYRDAIAGIESGGNYKAIGPETKTGDRAYGKYQMMGENIGPWTEAALGKRLSPHEFLSSPEAQDVTFDHIFGGYVSKYGPEGAAQAWFGGPGSVGKIGRKDMLGTSVGDYGKRFMRGIGANNTLAGGEAGDQLQASLVQPAPADQVSPLFGQVTPQLRANGVQPQQTAETLAPVQTAETVPGQEIGAGYDASSPIIRALMGLSGPDTAPRGGQYPAAPGTPEGDAFAAQAASGPSMEQLMAAMNNPWASEGQQRLAGALLSDRLKRSDPEYQLELKTKQAQLDALTRPPKQWQKLNDTTLFDPVSGETMPIAGGAQVGLFSGNSVEAEGLNFLIQQGKITQEQAAEVAAGKTVTDPATGAIIFLTPSGIVSQMPGQPPQPIAPPDASQAAPAGGPVATGQATGAAGSPTAPAPSAGIQLTEGKPKAAPTEQEMRNSQLYQVSKPELDIVTKNFDALNDFGNQMGGKVPGVSNYLTSPEYQRAFNSLRVIIASYLYSTSGATANPGEVENQARALLPEPGESPPSVADKKRRVQTMVDAIRTAAGNAAPSDTSPSSATGAGLPKPQTQQDFDALPKGTHYIDPDDGKEYVK